MSLAINMITKDQAETMLRRIFSGGIIDNMPKRSSDAQLLFALAASSLTSQIKYSEQEINEHLKEWLDGFASTEVLDHVTIRRCLIDHGLLLREPSGATYEANQAVISSYVDASARSIHPGDILEEVQKEKKQRKRTYGS